MSLEPLTPTKKQIIKRLRRVANTLEKLGADIDYYGGMASWALHGRQMVTASAIALQWANEIEKQLQDEAKKRTI